MKKRTTALLLTAALALSLLGANALAAEGGTPGEASGQPAQAQTGQAENAPPSAQQKTPQPRTEALEDGQEPQEQQEQPYIPDPVGSVSFANLEKRMRQGNLNMLALEEQIRMLESIDYEEMQEDVRKGLNSLSDAQWQLISAGSAVQIPGADSNPMLGGINDAISASMSMSASMASQSLQTQYDALRETFDDLKDGKLQKDNADVIRQLKNAQDQVVMAGETLYVALLDMERSGQGLSRRLTALDRTLEELELRYQLGHISSQTLKQTRAGRTSLVSGMQTLSSNIETYKLQLEMLIGAELTGGLRLGALPQVTGGQLEEMDLERDLAAAKQASYSLYAARLTLEDAEETYKDSGEKYGYSERHYEYTMALHQWQAAQHSYNAAVQSFEMSFRTLFLQVKDCKQVLDASRTALAVEQDSYSVAQLKQSQGNLSQNGLLDAQDKLKEAQDAVADAAADLFTAYHNYRWAVDCGILN